MKRTKNGFDRMSTAQLIQNVQVIIVAIATNPGYFPSPEPKVAVIEDMLEQLKQAEIEAASGDRLKIAIRKEKQAALIKGIRQLGLYVDVAANGNPIILEASKFPVDKNPQPRPYITHVPSPQLSIGLNSGQVIVKGERFYQRTNLFRYTHNVDLPVAQWLLVPSYKSTVVLNDLEIGKVYAVRQGVLEKDGEVIYSEPSTIVGR